MADKDIQDQAQGDSQPRPLSKPRRQSGWRVGNLLPFLLLLSGVVILVGGGGVLLWIFVPHQASGGMSSAASSVKSAQPGPCSSRLPWTMIQQELARELHLSLEQVKEKVHTGKKIQDIAAEQGIPSQQLYTLELHAYQMGNEQWKKQGCLTQRDFDDNKQRYSSETPAQLNDDFTGLFSQ